MTDHEHDRFLSEEHTMFIFGCINPFCGHGSPALPKRYKIPKETNEVKLKLLSHLNRKVTMGVTIKETGKRVVFECDDNLVACSKAFASIDA